MQWSVTAAGRSLSAKPFLQTALQPPSKNKEQRANRRDLSRSQIVYTDEVERKKVDKNHRENDVATVITDPRTAAPLNEDSVDCATRNIPIAYIPAPLWMLHILSMMHMTRFHKKWGRSSANPPRLDLQRPRGSMLLAVVSVLNTATDQNWINRSFLLLLWHDHIKPTVSPNPRAATKQAMHIDSLTSTFLWIGYLPVCAWFGVSENPAFDVVWTPLS